MEQMTLWILLMSVITFIARYAFFSKNMPLKLNEQAKLFLLFTGPCILTAMWTPIVFSEAIHSYNLLNPYVIAGVFTIIASLFIRQTLLVIMLSMVCFYTLRHFL